MLYMYYYSIRIFFIPCLFNIFTYLYVLFLVFLLFWLPSTIQFYMFSLLTVFYAKVLDRTEWHVIKKIVIPLSYVIMILSLGATIYWAWSAAHAGLDDKNQEAERIEQSFEMTFVWVSGLAFIFLAILLFYDGIRIMKLERHEV